MNLYGKRVILLSNKNFATLLILSTDNYLMFVVTSQANFGLLGHLKVLFSQKQLYHEIALDGQTPAPSKSHNRARCLAISNTTDFQSEQNVRYRSSHSTLDQHFSLHCFQIN